MLIHLVPFSWPVAADGSTPCFAVWVWAGWRPPLVWFDLADFFSATSFRQASSDKVLDRTATSVFRL